MPALKNLIGKRFGRLLVIKRSLNKVYPSGLYRTMWFCKCDCGRFLVVDSTCLNTGHTQSCGCYQRDQTSKANKKHGFSSNRLYSIWRAMLDRVCNQENSNYKRYGGRGISVCDEWKDITTFIKWARSNGYRSDLTIDRINNDGNYEPSNCRWVAFKQQSRNRSTNRHIKYNGETLCLIDAAKKYKIHKNTLAARLERGWSIKKALLEPTHTNCRNGRAKLCG